MQIGIILYVGIWLAVVIRNWRRERRGDITAFSVDADHNDRSVAKTFGCLPAFGLVIIISLILPTVYVARPDGNGLYEVKKIYVPFCYRGTAMGPGTRYLSNETGQELGLYYTQVHGTFYSKTSEEYDIVPVPRDTVMWWKYGIQCEFSRPYCHSIFVGNKRKSDKPENIWTINLLDRAISDVNEIQRERYKNIFPDPGRMTYPDYTQKYLDSVKKSLRVPSRLKIDD